MSDTRQELEFDKWVQENKFTCPTCRFNPTEDPVCSDCEGQNWVEKDWAQYNKRLKGGAWHEKR